MKNRAKVETVNFDGVSFNKKSILAYKNEAAFLDAYNGKGYTHEFKDDPKRAEKLKQLYALATNNAGKAVK